MMAYRQGKFKPRNPEKYLGDPTEIIYRSGWELKLFHYLDMNKSIVKWSSESIIIPYRSPIDGKMHRYFPDVFMITSDGRKVLVEIKPHKETKPPETSKGFTKKGTPTRRFLNEVKTWGMNEAKWKAAQEYCLDRGWNFVIMTEYELGIKKK